MTTVDEMLAALGKMEREGRVAYQWRFSPEGWDKLRANVGPDMFPLQFDRERIKTVFGIPYVVACDLPPETSFVLEDKRAAGIRNRAELERARDRQENAEKLRKLAEEAHTIRDK